YAISSMNRARAEEVDGRAEQLLATPTPRASWLAANMGITFLTSTILVFVTMVGMWGGATSAGMTDPGPGDYLTTSVAYVAAFAVIIGVSGALFAWVPRLQGWTWLVIGIGFVIGVFGPVFNLPGWMSW